MPRIGYWEPSAYGFGPRKAVRRLIDSAATAAIELWGSLAPRREHPEPPLADLGPPGARGAPEGRGGRGGRGAPEAPEVAALESGDLLWSKNPNAIIPYRAASGGTESEEVRWLAERDRYLASLASLASLAAAAQPALTNDHWRRRRLLERMDYAKFVGVFANDESPHGPSAHTGGQGVGHTAIVRIREGAATIVEAVWGLGVREIAYADWASERKDDRVWHGRVKNPSPAARSAIAEYAVTQVGKPHDFWNFDLGDESGFYCSKLAWLSILKGTHQAADGRTQTRRLLWLSPKQLLAARENGDRREDGDRHQLSQADPFLTAAAREVLERSER